MKDKKPMYKLVRRDWGDIKPVQKVKPSKKVYDRNKLKDIRKEWE